MSVQPRRKASEGFKRVVNDWFMQIKMNLWIFFGLFIIQIFLFFLVLHWFPLDFTPLRYWPQLIISSLWATFPNHPVVVLDLGEGLHTYLATDVRDWILSLMSKFLQHGGKIFVSTSSVYLFGFLAQYYFRSVSNENSKLKHLRGAQVISEKELQNEIRNKNEKTTFSIGSVPMLSSYNLQHGLILGANGTGKTNLQSGMYESLVEQGYKIILYDYKRELYKRHFRPGRDLLFDPVHECQDSIAWTPFNEFTNKLSVAATSGSLFAPSANEREPYWRVAPREVASGLLHYLWRTNQRTNKDIWNAINLPVEEIRKRLKRIPEGLMGLRHLEGTDGQLLPQTAGVLSGLAQYMSAFNYMQDIRGSFSITSWIRDGKPGTMFLTNSISAQDEVKGVFTLFLDLAGYGLAEMPDDLNRKVVFMFDEFGTLHRLNIIVKLLATIRSRGGSVWLAAQDLGSILRVYGEEDTETLFNNCGTKVIFRVDAPKTLSFVEQAFGEREILVTEEGFTMGTENNRDGLSLGRKTRIEKVVLGSEISTLPNLHCYLKMLHHNPARIHTPLRIFPERNPDLKIRKGLDLDKTIIPEEDEPLSF
ncbi:MAG: type IV secretion system DNA-binding domain-containing protein [Nitrospirae bacterium]|nr:type IV secretion system DNA-binding domain-containing protein [Nitrospirota bacterium]